MACLLINEAQKVLLQEQIKKNRKSLSPETKRVTFPRCQRNEMEKFCTFLSPLISRLLLAIKSAAAASFVL